MLIYDSVFKQLLNVIYNDTIILHDAKSVSVGTFIYLLLKFTNKILYMCVVI